MEKTCSTHLQGWALNNSISSTASDTWWKGLTTALQNYSFWRNNTCTDESCTSYRLPLYCATGAFCTSMRLWKVDFVVLILVQQIGKNFKRSEMNTSLKSPKTYQIIHWDFCIKTCQSSKELRMTEMIETANTLMWICGLFAEGSYFSLTRFLIKYCTLNFKKNLLKTKKI